MPKLITTSGQCFKSRANSREAADAFHRPLTLRPNFPEVLCNLAVTLQHEGDYSVAATLLRRAIALNPSLAEAHSNLGGNLWRQGDLAGAIASCRHAIALNSSLPEADSNLGHALSDRGDLDEAMASYRRALALKPNSGKFLHYIAITYLLRGEFATVWPQYENRLQTKALCNLRRDFSQPMWCGEPLEGSRILLHAEQGLGDTLQFVRWFGRSGTAFRAAERTLQRCRCGRNHHPRRSLAGVRVALPTAQSAPRI